MVFRFLVGRTAKFFGRSVNLLFFTLLYREMYKEIVEVTGNETQASQILKMIGLNGTFESARRQMTVLRMFPNDPVRVMETLDIIWFVIFGTKLDEYELQKIPREGEKYPDLIFRISKCPICGGYGSSPLDSVDCNKIQPEESFYATGLVGMLEETANFILELKKNDYRILMQETKCFCRGDDVLELKCHIVHKSELNQDIQQLDSALKRPFLMDSDFDNADDILSRPLDAIKKQLVIVIEEKMEMSSYEFMEYFKNYEKDVIRIIGFLLVHIFNENGRIIEKTCEKEAIAKLIGHLYNNSIKVTELTLPLDIVQDYKATIIELLTDIAPPEILDKFNEIPPEEMIQLFYEGIKKALLDLGVNFDGLKSNIWEEMEVDRIFGDGNEKSKISEEEKQEQIRVKTQLIQEVFLLLMGIVAIPNKIILSSIHGTAKSIFSSSGDSISHIRDQAAKVLDLIDRLH
ncbi:MAG: hypothetical protein JW776_03565 [Candidatus Lokiarchaeota archaeon]|nr:hypothetical protein [Candidatus Lokiarchaeota archaeon]